MHKTKESDWKLFQAMLEMLRESDLQRSISEFDSSLVGRKQ